MTLVSPQMELDYIESAHQRVAADTELLEKRATVTILAGQSSVALDPEVISVSSVFNGSQPLTLIPTVEYMRLVTGANVAISDPPLRAFFVIVSRTLYVWPLVSGTDVTLTLFYTYRPAAITDASTLELVGNAKRLVERLTSAYILYDDGQPEVGQQELISYQNDAKRLAKRNRGAWGSGGALQLAGRRRPG